MNSPHFPRKKAGRMRLWVLCLLGLLAGGRVHAFDAEAVKPSVPRILLTMGQKNESGSGFVIHAESDYCIVATNYHVIADDTASTSLYVLRKAQGGVEVHKAEVIYKDADRDLALLKVPGLNAPALTLSTVEPAQAEDVYSIGYPGVADDKESRMALLTLLANGREGVIPDPSGRASVFLEASVAKGGVRRLIMDHWHHLPTNFMIRIIQHDVNIGHGNSGGPLFNAAGQVVGVNTATATYGKSSMDVDRLSASSHISVLMDVLKQQGISFLQSDTVPAVAAPVVSGNNVAAVPGGGTSSVLLSIVAILAVVALVLAMRKREALVESYSHYVKRTGGRQGATRDEEENASAITTPPENVPLRRPPAPATIGAGILEGRDPDDRTAIKLAIDDALWEKTEGKIIVGRSSKNAHLCLANKSVSGAHLSLIRQDARVLVEDRESSNGTSLNGKKLLPYAPVQIDDGDWLQIGDVLLRFKAVKS